MKPELREQLGQAAFAQWRKEGEDLPVWDEMPEIAKLYFCNTAEAVVQKLAEIAVVPLVSVLFSEADIKRLLEEVA